MKWLLLFVLLILAGCASDKTPSGWKSDNIQSEYNFDSATGKWRKD